MSMQKIALKQFHECYPHAKLKEISEQTGIQITRVFRILNGAEMKVSELERFQEATNTNKANQSFIDISRRCALNLSEGRRKFIQGIMEQSLKLHSFTTTTIHFSSEVSHEL